MTRATRPSAARWLPPVASSRVYWDKRHRVFFGKYRLNGRWKNKLVPVNIDTGGPAYTWFRTWFETLQRSGVEPANNEITVDERKTIRKLAKRWLDWKRDTNPNDRKLYDGCTRTLDKWVLSYRRPRARAVPRALYRVDRGGEEGGASGHDDTQHRPNAPRLSRRRAWQGLGNCIGIGKAGPSFRSSQPVNRPSFGSRS
jgi:hypothetical protein